LDAHDLDLAAQRLHRDLAIAAFLALAARPAGHAPQPRVRPHAVGHGDADCAGHRLHGHVTVALRTDEQDLFCDWAERNEPTYNIWYSAGGNFQSRVGVTAAMMNIAGADIPGEIVVPHVMRQVTEADCDENRPHASVSGTSLVPDEVLTQMFASS